MAVGPTGVCMHLPTVTCPNCTPWVQPQHHHCHCCCYHHHCHHQHGSPYPPPTVWRDDGTGLDPTVTFYNTTNTGDIGDPQAGELH